MRAALRICLAVLSTSIAAEAPAQPPDWMLDSPFMPHQGRIGVKVQSMTPGLREFFDVPTDRGVLVSEVLADRPAAAAGLEVGDVIVSGAGAPIREPFDLVKSVARVPSGEKLLLEVFRKGEKRKLEIAPEGDPVRWMDPEQWREWFDEHVNEGSEQLRERLRELEERLERLERRLNQGSGAKNHPI